MKVFQEEQQIDQQADFDGNDEVATHVVVYNGTDPIGTGRMRPIEEGTVKIERVAVVSEMRGRGIGTLIMRSMNEYLVTTGIERITLDAQLHAKGFYENLGYVQQGDVF